MTSFLLKVVSLPIILIVMMYLLDSVNYASIWQPIVLGVILAIVGVAMEYMILRKSSLAVSVFSDFVVSLILIWFISNLFNNANVTFFGALVTSVVIGIVEYFVHRFLLHGEPPKRIPA